MPSPLITSLMKKTNLSVEKVEIAWEQAKDSIRAKNIDPKNRMFWALVNKEVHKRLGLKESQSSFKSFLGDVKVTSSSEFIASYLFALRQEIHARHLSAKTYNVHLVLGELYEYLNEYVDRIIETIQGELSKSLILNPIDLTRRTIVDLILASIEQLENNQKDLQVSSSLSSLVDDVVATLNQTNYKLSLTSGELDALPGMDKNDISCVKNTTTT